MKTHRVPVGAILTLMSLAVLRAQSNRPSIRQLSVPPPEQYHIERFWNVTLNNPTRKAYDVYLAVTITEAVKGQVFWAWTNQFPLPRGVKVIRYDDVLSVGIERHTCAPGYRDFARGVGGLPDGDYTFAVTLEPNFDSQSVRFNVAPVSPPGLLYPGDGATVPPGILVFTWRAPPGPASRGVKYTVRVAEVLPGMTKEQALNSARPWFEQRNIRVTSLTYPARAPAFCENRQYAWQVAATADDGTARSEVCMFTLRNGGSVPQSRPDWVLSSPTANVVDDGRSLSAGVTVKNAGSGSSPTAMLQVWLKSDGNVRKVEKVPALEPEDSRLLSSMLPLPSARGGMTDTVFFEVKGDGDAAPRNNRAAAGFQVPVSKRPDLAVDSIWHQSVNGAAILTLHVLVANHGDAASGPAMLEVTCTPSVWPQTQAALPSVLQGRTDTVSLEFQVPLGRRGTTVRFSVRAIPIAGEVNRQSNLRAYSVALPDTQRLPNLSLTNHGWKQEGDGSQLVFWVDVRNDGASRSGSTRLELTSNGNTEPVETGVQSMAPQASQPCTLTVDVPKNLRGKTVQFGARVDPQNSVPESNEDDNVLSTLVPILIGPPRPWPALLVVIAAVCAVAATVALTWLVARSPVFRHGRPKESGARTSPRGPGKEAKPDEAATGRLPETGPAAAGAVRRAADDVYFTVTAPAEVVPEADFLVSLWAHLDAQREEVLKRAHQAEPDTRLQAPGAGPFAIARDTELDLLLAIEDCTVEPKQGTIRWTGAIANAGFLVRVNGDAVEGSKRGYASVRCSGLEIARVRFLLKVTSAANTAATTEASSQTHRRAFASYARADSHDVLTCIQGMEKALPGISIFFDVLKFRSGECWQTRLQQEILASDIFYLFWSKAAASSEWVEKEWRFGLEKKGLDFIDPVPLVSPRVAPPPPELSAKHFDDWELAFKCYREKTGQRASSAS